MDEKETKPVADMESYTLHMFMKDILESEIQEVEKRFENGASRDFQSKLIVMTMLLRMLDKYSSTANTDKDELASLIEMQLNNDELLSGYMFYISQNPNFDYTWHYMRERKQDFIKFLCKIIRFLHNVLLDINRVSLLLCEVKELRIVFNDLLVVSINEQSNSLSTRMLWKNFYALTSVGKKYYFYVKINDCIILSGKRESSTDVESIVSRAASMVDTNK